MKKNANFTKLVLILMLFGLITSLISCSASHPKCDDKDVKKILTEIINEKLQAQLESMYFRNNYSYEDVRNYAKDNGLDIDEVDAEFEKNVKGKAKEIASKQVANANISFEEVRTLNIEEEIKKCDCATKIIIDKIDLDENDLSMLALENLLISNLTIFSGMDIKYSAQYTEDDKIYVELYY
jgi:hypothetical protein